MPVGEGCDALENWEIGGDPMGALRRIRQRGIIGDPRVEGPESEVAGGALGMGLGQ